MDLVSSERLRHFLELELPNEIWLEIAPQLVQRTVSYNPDVTPTPAYFGDMISLASTCRMLYDFVMPCVYSLAAADLDGEPHLIYAAFRGCQYSFDKLRDAGARLSLLDEDEPIPSAYSFPLRESWASPLHAAAQSGHVEMVKHLFRLYGSKLSQVAHQRISPESFYITPLDIAASKGHLEVVKLLKDVPLFEPRTPLQNSLVFAGSRGAYLGGGIRSAAGSGQLEIVKYLLGEGGDLCFEGERTCYALAQAIQFGHSDVVKHLLSVDAPHEDFFVLVIACHYQPSLEMVQILLDHGVDMFAENTSGINVLHHCLQDPKKNAILP